MLIRAPSWQTSSVGIMPSRKPTKAPSAMSPSFLTRNLPETKTPAQRRQLRNTTAARRQAISNSRALNGSVSRRLMARSRGVAGCGASIGGGEAGAGRPRTTAPPGISGLAPRARQAGRWRRRRAWLRPRSPLDCKAACAAGPPPSRDTRCPAPCNADRSGRRRRPERIGALRSMSRPRSAHRRPTPVRRRARRKVRSGRSKRRDERGRRGAACLAHESRRGRRCRARRRPPRSAAVLRERERLPAARGGVWSQGIGGRLVPAGPKGVGRLSSSHRSRGRRFSCRQRDWISRWEVSNRE